MCIPVDNSWWGQGPQRPVKYVSDPPCSQFWGHYLLGTWNTTGSYRRAVRRNRFTEGCAFKGHSLGKRSRGSFANLLCKMLTTWQGKSVYFLLSLIMSRLLLDVVWTHLTKVIWNIPFFFFSYLFLKLCWLFFLFGIAVLARGSGQLGPVSLNSSGLFPPKKL